MAIAMKVEDYMARCGAKFEVVTHPRSRTSMETAELAHVPGDRVVKSVILEDEEGMLMAVLPSTCSVRLGQLGKDMHRRLRLATEDELGEVFPDCRIGAIPPLGTAYGVRTVMDDTLASQSEVYFEGGDHECLVHMSGEQFMALMRDAERGHFSHRMRAVRR